MGLLSATLGAQIPPSFPDSIPADSVKIYKRASYRSDNPRVTRIDLLVDSVLRSYMQSPENCGISVAVSKDGKSAFYNYGEISRNSGTLPGPNTLYEIGSLTAGFTGFLVIQASLEKKISLDDELRKFFPGEFKNLDHGKSTVKIKHLLAHTSGLPHLPDDLTLNENYNAKDPYNNYTADQLVSYLQRAKLSFEPGTNFDYSSLAMALMGQVLEKTYGSTFDELVRQKINQPLSLTNTAVNLNAQQMQNFAAGYSGDGEPVPHWSLNTFASAGGLRSSVADMAIFTNFSMDEKNSAGKLAGQISIGGGKKTSPAWLVSKTRQGNTLFYQSGGTFGSAGLIGYVKEKKVSVVVIANSSRSVDYIAIALLNYLQQ